MESEVHCLYVKRCEVCQRGDTEAQSGYGFCMLQGQVALTCRLQAQL